MVSATANGTLYMPGDTGFYYTERTFDVPAHTTWQVYTYPGLATLGAFAVGDNEGTTIRVDNAGVVNTFNQPSRVVGSAWQAELPFTIPTWVRSDEGLAFFAGFFLIATVRITRAGLRWLSRAGEDLPSS